MHSTISIRTVNVYKYLKKKWFIKVQGYNPVVNVQFLPGFEKKAMAAMKKIHIHKPGRPLKSLNTCTTDRIPGRSMPSCWPTAAIHW